MNNNNDEGSLELLNRLLERLHQADYINQGSKIEVVYVASGGQHVETQINIGAYPQPLPKGREKGTGNLPDVHKACPCFNAKTEYQDLGLKLI